MKNILIAHRYSLAMFKAAETKIYDLLLKDIASLTALFDEFQNLVHSTNSYLIPIEQRFSVAESLAENLHNKEIWRNLFRILIKRHKFSLINAIIDDLEHLILDSKNTAKVILKVAHKQSEETINAIKSQIREILQKEIILEIITQPEIIGGFIAETKSLQIDGSVRNNLEKFKISMIK